MRRRRGKYNARRTVYRGQTYDSAAEAAYAAVLDGMKRIGKIYEWRRGRVYILVDGPSRRRRITYKPDFEVLTEDGAVVHVIDVKGVVTPVFRLKAILWRRRFPDLPLVIVNHKGAELDIFATKKRRAA